MKEQQNGSAEGAQAPVQEVVEPKPKREPAARPAPVAIRGGALSPKDASELERTIGAIAKGGGFPERFTSFEQRVAAYNLAHSLMGGEWQLALNNIAIIKGQMAIFGELPGSLAERTGKVADKEMYVVDKDYNRICIANKNLDAAVFAGVCRMKRLGGTWNEFFYTINEAISAGQYPPKKRDGSPNNDSPWMKHTKVMLMRKAMNQAVKFCFPESMVGVPIAEYDYDEAPDFRDVTPVDKARVLNDSFKPPETPPVPAGGETQQ